MKWNNGKERAKVEKEQAEKRKKYLAAGMTEEEIQTLLNFDKNYFRSQRREATHTQRLNISAFAESERVEEPKNPLLKKFLHSLTVEDKHFEGDRYGWIEEIENKKLYLAIKSLSNADKELLTQYIFDGLTQTEIAEIEGVTNVVICKKIKRIKEFLKKFLGDG